MVPGMAERERLAADLRRAEWLAGAELGPDRANGSFTRSVTETKRQPDRQIPVLQLLATFAFTVRHGMSRILAGPANQDQSLPETAPAQPY